MKNNLRRPKADTFLGFPTAHQANKQKKTLSCYIHCYACQLKIKVVLYRTESISLLAEKAK